MDYDEWIRREQRLRIRILENSPLILKEHFFRVCAECGEILLCHEENCPNCNSTSIDKEKIDDFATISNRIRCKFRFIKIQGGK
ncbi:MAG: hypothetical protein QMD44_07330 [Thermodesulfovibrionales bacterium]|nr:hypothetical protein [Thermodesulfovibrionales bacterium]